MVSLKTFSISSLLACILVFGQTALAQDNIVDFEHKLGKRIAQFSCELNGDSQLLLIKPKGRDSFELASNKVAIRWLKRLANKIKVLAERYKDEEISRKRYRKLKRRHKRLRNFIKDCRRGLIVPPPTEDDQLLPDDPPADDPSPGDDPEDDSNDDGSSDGDDSSDDGQNDDDDGQDGDDGNSGDDNEDDDLGGGGGDDGNDDPPDLNTDVDCGSDQAVFYFDFEENDPTLAVDQTADQTGTSNDGICIDYSKYPGHTCPVPAPNEGIYGDTKFFSPDSEESHYTVEGTENLDLSTFTARFWAYPFAPNNTDKMSVIRQIHPNNQPALSIHFKDNTNKPNLVCRFDPGASQSNKQEINEEFPAWDWIYGVCVYDEVSNQFTLYGNDPSKCGVDSSGNAKVCVLASKTSSQGPSPSPKPIGIGNYAIGFNETPTNSTFDDNFNGYLDEIYLTNQRAWDFDEVQLDYDLFLQGVGGICR